MVDVQRIDSLDHPELAPYKAMRGQVEQREGGIFVAESDKVVRRMLESELRVVSLLLPEKWLSKLMPLLEKRPEDIRVYLLEKSELERLTGFTFYQGVLGIGKVPKSPSIEALLASKSPPRLLVAVEGVCSAENLGGMVRSGAAFGVDGFLVDRSSSSPYLRRAVRSSMGTIFRIPAIEKLDLAHTMLQLRDQGFRCVAAHPRAEARPLFEADLTGDTCIVFGSEGYGITPDLLDACDDAVAIPMMGGVDSLNVASAASVFLFEAMRQRRRQKRKLG